MDEAGDSRLPVALSVAVGVAIALAVAILASALTVKHLSQHGGSLPGGIFLAGVLLGLARGMHQSRYWAVLAFEALLAFQIVVTSLALVLASTWQAAGLCTLGIGLSGWLFWKLVKVMASIQAQDRALADGGGDSEGPSCERTDEALR